MGAPQTRGADLPERTGPVSFDPVRVICRFLAHLTMAVTSRTGGASDEQHHGACPAEHRTAVVTRWQTDKRAPADLVAFLFDRLDDDEAVTQRGPLRALREVAAKRVMVEMWFDGVQADFSRLPVAGLNVADAMIMALVTVYADHPLFDAGWLAEAEQPDRPAGSGLDNVVELRPGHS